MKLLFASLVALIISDVFTTLEGKPPTTGRSFLKPRILSRGRRAVPDVSSIRIDIRSEGCNDPGRTPNTCGRAYIKVNGNEHSKQKRGHNVVVVNAVTGIVEHSVSFDTHGSTAATNQMKDFLNGIAGDKIILIAVQDEGSRYLKPGFDALKRIGGYDLSFLDHRGSYALVGYSREKKPSYVQQVQSKGGKGPSVISTTVPLTKNPFVDIDIRSEGCNDPNKKPDTCGIAYIKVDGKDHSLHRRGHNVVIVERKTGRVLKSEAFDTHGDGSAGTRLKDFLNAQGEDKIVLVAVQDSAASHVGVALDSLRRVGAIDPILVEFRGSYALIGTPDANKPPWVSQDQHPRYKGPSEISIRIPLLDCQKALGMENYGIPNGKVRASSEWDSNHAAIQGRLHYKPPRGKQGAWSARHNNINQWLQVDLGSAFIKVTGVATQGRYNYDQWVTKYKLQYSNDGATFTYYKEPGQTADMVFSGNTDRNTVVYHFLNAPVTARYIRFRTVTWSGHISMRVELYGCSACEKALGMASYAIPNGQVKASSEWDPNHAAIQGRLHYLPPPGKQGGWSAKYNKANQWLQIDLGALFRVTAVATQGRSNYNQWVTKYKLQYSDNGATFTYYMEAGQNVAKEFVANKDRNTVVYHSLNPPKTTHFIRFRPVAWKSHISMRVEVYGCSACGEALGMASYAIPNGQVKASSEWDPNHAAIQGRLHYLPPPGKQGGWSAKHNNANQWLQIDLGALLKVTAVATQGRSNLDQWVTKYKLQYSDDGATFTYYMEGGQSVAKEFAANKDRSTIVYHSLNPPKVTRFIRFRPVAWKSHISMRVEVYGCSACGEALGMASYAIPNGQVRASSEWDPNHAAIQGRLHYLPPPGKQGGWSAKHNNANQWLQIDLGALLKVTAVATQGRSNHDQWVTKYKLQYSDDGATFTYYMEAGQSVAKEFVANKDRSSVVYHSLNPPKLTRFIRFRPVSWKSHISMRVEVYGCSARDYCAQNPCKNGATCSNVEEGYECTCKPGYSGAQCDQDINECTNSPCQNGATCVNLQGSYRCDCKSGYNGNKCENDINECSNNPCKNGATCVNLQGSYSCDCKSGYNGNNCENDINECSNSPCKNGATCVNIQGSYRCDCKSGYNGNNCENDINECSNNPCKNGATCVNLQGSHRCDCKSGYNGNNCENDINECTNSPCKNGATCVNLQGSYRCDCKSGYNGNNCETDINECSNNPCKNGATCVNLQGSHRCDCKSGYDGNNCENDINECSNSPCKNGATCVNLEGSYRCDCKSGYDGNNCENDVNECTNNPCKNGATCVNLSGGHRCDCAKGYSGSSCETAINDCAPDPCLNGGTCVDLVDGFRCDCAAGWLGITCDEPEVDECEE